MTSRQILTAALVAPLHTPVYLESPLTAVLVNNFMAWDIGASEHVVLERIPDPDPADRQFTVRGLGEFFAATSVLAEVVVLTDGRGDDVYSTDSVRYDGRSVNIVFGARAGDISTFIRPPGGWRPTLREVRGGG